MMRKFKHAIIGSQLEGLNSFHDKTRINLLYNIALFMICIGTVGSIISIVLETYSILIPSLGNITLAILVIYLIKSINFQFAAKIYFFALTCLLFGNLLFNEGTMHIGAPFWIMILNILVLYILGKNWGVLSIILSTLGFCYYIIFVLPTTIDIVQDLPKNIYYSALYETVFALSLLGYVLFIMLTASKGSDQLLRENNKSLKIQNNTILISNQEKTILLKEIHHRVKNNLQVIVSLMRLQMRTLKSNEATLNYQETINRVVTMSMIHEKIYQSESLSQVNLKKYFHDLSLDLIATFQTSLNVDLDYQFEVDKIGLKTIVPLALIFNELFSNSLKHAFLKTDKPKITLSIKALNDTSFVFDYQDNGSWVDSNKKETFGMELIDSLTSQLEGEMTFVKTPQTKYQFKFKHLDL